MVQIDACHLTEEGAADALAPEVRIAALEAENAELRAGLNGMERVRQMLVTQVEVAERRSEVLQAEVHELKAALIRAQHALEDAQIRSDPMSAPTWIDRATWVSVMALGSIRAKHPDAAPERDPEGKSIAHLIFMAQTLARRELDSETKACRWLGYLQAGLVFHGLSDLETEKELNIESRSALSA